MVLVRLRGLDGMGSWVMYNVKKKSPHKDRNPKMCVFSGCAVFKHRVEEKERDTFECSNLARSLQTRQTVFDCQTSSECADHHLRVSTHWGLEITRGTH